MRIKILHRVLWHCYYYPGCYDHGTNWSSAGSAGPLFRRAATGRINQKLGEVTGVQSNWMTGVGNESSSIRGAANDLRNKAAAMGGNVIYGLNGSSGRVSGVQPDPGG